MLLEELPKNPLRKYLLKSLTNDQNTFSQEENRAQNFEPVFINYFKREINQTKLEIANLKKSKIKKLRII